MCNKGIGLFQNHLHLNQHSKRLLDELVSDANTYGLVLFVGSGINGTALLRWQDLLVKLLGEAINVAAIEDDSIRQLSEPLQVWCNKNFDACALASIAKRILGPERYRLEIQDALYARTPDLEEQVEKYCRERKNGNAKEKSKYEFLHAAAEICCLPQVKAVATFNFDTLLETAIAATGPRKPRAYFGQTADPERPISSESDIPVYHIHGLLAPPKTLLRIPEESIVFSYDEYFEKNADPLSWETATPLHLLRNYCTVWLGTSLRDWNMMRLLNSAFRDREKTHSYCIQSLQEVRPPNSLANRQRRNRKRNFQNAAMRLQATLLDVVGMHLILAGARYDEIPGIIREFITRPLREREKVQSS